MKKEILIALPLIAILNCIFAQNVISTVGKTKFFDNLRDSSAKNKTLEMAQLCNLYIAKFYPNHNLSILLDFEQSNDTTYYQLGYDNIYGNSIFNDVYKPKTEDFTNLGIRIKSCRKEINEENILKLLEYGITHLKYLQDLRVKSMNMDYYDRPKNSTLDYTEIENILKQTTSNKVKFVLTHKN